MEWTMEIGCAYDCAISVGTITLTGKVSLQLKDYAGNDLKEIGRVTCYITSDAAGLLTDTVTSIIINTDGILHKIEDTKSYELISATDGDIDLTLDGVTNETVYLHVVLPNGRVKHSAAITFTG